MDIERQRKIEQSLEEAKYCESLSKSKKYTNLSKMLINSLNTTNEIKEFNKIFSKNIKKKFFTLPKTLRDYVLKSLFNKNYLIKEYNEEALLRAGLIGLTLNSKDSLKKYVNSNLAKTNENKELINISKEYSLLIYSLKQGESLNNNNHLKIFHIEEIKKAIKNKLNIEEFFKKIYNFKIKEIPTAIYAILKYKENKSEALKDLIKFNNSNILYNYGLIYGLIYQK